MQRAEATGLLRRAGLRVTAPRVGVLLELADSPHADVDGVRRGVLGRLGSVSTQTIYDVLHILEDSSLVRRLDTVSGRARYELETGDHHEHLVCRGCNAISDVRCATGPAAVPMPEDTQGYLVLQTEIQYVGLCPRCQEPAARRAPTPR
ncbi:Fur family transcriptional regulator, ferric uptake regulator [Raineyella antarctica]|uniref:Fur family transcriptional regulator, ferric uptake regulator n=1 Tax=Raineyella antarctica TaxID=1577474 RepID=A0A1G6HAZ5_9ACTN|nr:Fur family transcriptional regulator [Raineyella antarctica]SDB91258.1 Fur family transcriptional regulator, ferric uptake regulator [Raineyella antarctica]